MNRIRKGDDVLVIYGKNKGKRGVVSFVDNENNKVVVEGLNLVKKHIKPNPIKGITGGLQSKMMPIHISNVALVDANNKPSRVRVLGVSGQKIRTLKNTGARIND